MPRPNCILLAFLLVLIGRAHPSAADAPRWAELGPPSFESGGAVLDSKRGRQYVSTDQSSWVVSSDPMPVWTFVPVGGGGFYDRLHDRFWSFAPGISGAAGVPGVLSMLDEASATPAWVTVPYTGADPRSRANCTQVYDPVGDRIVLFGGLDKLASPVNDTYVLTLSGTPNWSSGTGLNPPTPRSRTAGIYDPFHDRILFFGGLAYPAVPLDETWAYSPSTHVWTFLEPRGSHPTGRGFATLVLDSLGQRVVMFGGGLTDTWALDLSPDAPADSATWQPLSTGAALPVDDPSIAWFEPAARRVLRYGSRLWSLDLSADGNWTLIADSLRSPPRAGGVAFTDRAGARWYHALGGSDVWSRPFDASTPWHLTASGGPSGRYFAGVAEDPAAGRALVFGGSDFSNPEAMGSEFGDLWAFSFATSSWQPLTPPTSPPPRKDALVLFDAARRRLIVQGGRATIGEKLRALKDTWAYDAAAGTWSPLATGTFVQRWSQAGIYDPIRDRIVAFAGRDSIQWFSDVLVLPLGGGVWTPLATTGTPPQTYDYRSVRAAYDAIGDRMLVIADADDPSNPNVPDVMVVYALSLGATPTWSQLTLTSDAPILAARRDYSFAQVAGGEGILMVGGTTNSGSAHDEGWVLFSAGGLTPVLVSLVSAEALSTGVRIVWQLAPGTAITYAQRRGVDGGWEDLPVRLADADGRVMVEDHSVSAGESWEYRVGFDAGGTVSWSAPVRLQIPDLPEFALEGAVENPTSSSLYVRFSLDQPRSVGIELLDVGGRRVLDRETGPLAAGRHTLLLESQPGRLAPGLYFIRLRSGPHEATGRVTLLR